MRRIGNATALLAVVIGLAACGGVVGGPASGEIGTAEAGPVEGDFTISTWPGYIDPGKDGSIAEFEEKTGVSVDYIEDVNDNVGFFGKVSAGLDEGDPGSRSMFVVTDWMAGQMFRLGYLQEIDPGSIKTVLDNLSPQFESEGAYDPEHKFSIPWQGGMTGIWVNTEQADEITSVNDLFDPKYSGRVTMLSEMRDTVPMVMRGMGVNMEDATKDDWLAAIDKLREATDSGQIRRFTGNEYTEDLTSGNAVAAIGWSGDGYLIGRDGVEWRRPEEGCNLWFDMMVIPNGAPNVPAAIEWMNFAYTPEVQADIAAFVNYVTPVEGVKEILQKRDPALAKNPLIFPDNQYVKDCYPLREPPGNDADIAEVTAAFQEIVSG